MPKITFSSSLFEDAFNQGLFNDINNGFTPETNKFLEFSISRISKNFYLSLVNENWTDGY